METIKVAVFEDNKPRRDLLELMINATEGFECTGTFNDCSNVLDDIKSDLPDVVLMDIDMPHVNGIEGLKKIRAAFPKIKILMQTIFEEEDKIFQAIVSGADGYILKKTEPGKMMDAIKEVMAGGAPMTPTVAKKVLKLFHHQNQIIKKNDFELTAREEEILKLLSKGLSYKMISTECNISYATVNTHINHIYEKLQVHSVVEAVTKALEHKIV